MKNNIKKRYIVAIKEKIKDDKFSWIFLLISISLFLIAILFKIEKTLSIITFFGNTLLKIFPAFVLVFIIMTFVNYFVTPKKTKKFFENKSNAYGWGISIVSGIISTGPIYLWYPLLADLKEHGVKISYIAGFLYARAIKPALIPLMILYFGIKFTIIVTIFTMIGAIINGIIVEKITNKSK